MSGAPVSSVAADVNRDGLLDVVTANSYDNTVSVFLGNGDGTFRAPMTFPAGNDPVSIVAGDFNGDGRLDLAVADHGDPSTGQGRGVSVLLGNGNGTFLAPEFSSLGGFPVAIASGDFGNRQIDLAVAVDGDGLTPAGVFILTGDGEGGFQVGPEVSVGDTSSIPTAIVAGDFGNGQIDLATANAGTDSVSVFLGDGEGVSAALPPLPLRNDDPNNYSMPQAIVAGDFGNGHTDLAVASYDPGDQDTVSILLGDGHGGFQPQPRSRWGSG